MSLFPFDSQSLTAVSVDSGQQSSTALGVSLTLASNSRSLVAISGSLTSKNRDSKLRNIHPKINRFLIFVALEIFNIAVMVET